jgi:hypothetical protein
VTKAHNISDRFTSLIVNGQKTADYLYVR